jgi:hypothetical protein
MLTAVADQVALSITVEVEPAHDASPRKGALPHRGPDRLSLPRNIGWKPDINR